MLTLKSMWCKMSRYRAQNRKHIRKGFLLQEIEAYRQAEGLIEEAKELNDAILNRDLYTGIKGLPAEKAAAVKDEAADCFCILIDFCIREGWSEQDISKAIDSKLNLRFGPEK